MKRFLQTLAASLWIWFLVWTCLVAVVWLTGFGEQDATDWARRRFLTPMEQAQKDVQPQLLPPLLAILRLLDPLWIVLATINAYASLVRERGLATARTWAGILLASGVAATLLLVFTTSVYFTPKLGMHVAGNRISLGWILLWAVVILGARELARLLLPRASHGATSLAAGLFALATALNLEPIALNVRVFWLWNRGWSAAPNVAPVWTYALWFGGAALLTYLFRAPEVVRGRTGPGWRAAVTLLILNGLCLAAHLAWRLQA